MSTSLRTRLLTRPLVFPGEKAWPADLADLYDRLKSDVSVDLPAGMGNLYIGPVQPQDVNTVWFKLSPAGNFTGIMVFVKGVWQDVSVPVGTITWRKGRPDLFTNGSDGWFVCDGTRGTNDFRSMFRTSNGNPVTGGSANKTFEVFWENFKGLLKTFTDATDASFTGTTVAEAAAYGKTLHDKVAAVLDGMTDYMTKADECTCNDSYDASLVLAFLVEFKGVQNA